MADKISLKALCREVGVHHLQVVEVLRRIDFHVRDGKEVITKTVGTFYLRKSRPTTRTLNGVTYEVPAREAVALRGKRFPGRELGPIPCGDIAAVTASVDEPPNRVGPLVVKTGQFGVVEIFRRFVFNQDYGVNPVCRFIDGVGVVMIAVNFNATVSGENNSSSSKYRFEIEVNGGETIVREGFVGQASTLSFFLGDFDVRESVENPIVISSRYKMGDVQVDHSSTVTVSVDESLLT